MLLALSAAAKAAVADDAAANFLTKLFITACIANAGQPDKVRAYASDRHLQQVTSPAALDVFVGSGGKGGAWAVPSAIGSFALSIRGNTEACSVYARLASPSEVERLFRTIVEGAARPGVDVKVIKESHDQSPSGDVHTLVYDVSRTDTSRGSFVYSMQTAEKAGGPFQASLQVALATRP